MTVADERLIAFGLLSAVAIELFAGMLWLSYWLEHDGPAKLSRAVREWLAYLRYWMGKDLDPRD